MGNQTIANLKDNARAQKNQAMGFCITDSGASILDLLNNQKTIKGFESLAGHIMTPERMLNLCINAIKKTPKLKQCSPESLLGAMMASAALGLEPNTILQQAYLIPYERKGYVDNRWQTLGVDCQFQVGYRGFLALAHRSESILDMEASAICEGDHFKYMQGSESFLEYQKSLSGRGDVIGAYAMVKLRDAEKAYVMPLEEILKVRSKSETYNALVRGVEYANNDKDRQKAQKKLADTPWVYWFEDMAAKSAVKKLAKFLDLTPGDKLSAATELDSGSDANIIDLSAMSDPDMAKAVADGEETLPAIEQLENELDQVAQQQVRPVANASLEEQAKQMAEAKAKRTRKPAAKAEQEPDDSFE